MTKVISIINQKGGVGKTTTSVNLSASLAKLGSKILLIDIDPQANATSGLGIDKTKLVASLYDVFGGVLNLQSVIKTTELPSLWIAPAHNNMVSTELEISEMEGREEILKDQLISIKNHFDYVIIDCPPSLGLLTVNAIVATDSLLIPLQSEYYALEGVSALMETIKVAKQQLNSSLYIEGVVITMFDSRTNLSHQVQDEAEKYFGNKLLKTVIPRNIKLGEAPSFGKPIHLYDPNSSGSLAYMSLAKEIIENNSSEMFHVKHLGKEKVNSQGGQ